LHARTFRLFTFSPIAIYPYEMDQQRQEFKLMGNQVKITISIYLDQAFEQQVIYLFRQTPLELGRVDAAPARFEVKHWIIQQRPHFRETMQFKAVSPISVTNIEDVKSNNNFLQPDNELYDISFFTHAVRRFKSAKQYKSLNNMKLLDPAFPMSFELLGQARSRLIHLKSNAHGLTQLRGFTCEFEISMPAPLIEFCYYAGYGEYPYLGFGFVDFLEEGYQPQKSGTKTTKTI
jgi:CRISPR-associated endoribonuclease Cas6